MMASWVSASILLAYFAAVQAENSHEDEPAFCAPTRISSIPKFTYDNGAPRKWGTLSEEYEKCGTGQVQSPINVLVNYTNSIENPPKIKGTKSVFKFHAGSNNFHLECATEFGSCGSISVGSNTFSLLQMHAHSPSENKISGRAYPLEMHFVHSDSDGNLAVVGVFFELGNPNPEFQAFLNGARERHYAVIDVEKLTKARSSDICKFDGSLTTPPCSEGVSWIVSLRQVTASLRQIGEYREMVGEKTNNRPIMPLNGRPITCYSGNKGSSVPGLA